MAEQDNQATMVPHPEWQPETEPSNFLPEPAEDAYFSAFQPSSPDYSPRSDDEDEAESEPPADTPESKKGTEPFQGSRS